MMGHGYKGDTGHYHTIGENVGALRDKFAFMKVRAALASAGKVDKEISETLFRMILLKAQRLSMTLLGMAGLKSHWLTVKASGSL